MSGPTAASVRPGQPGQPGRPAADRWRAGRALAGAGLSLLGAVAFAPAFGRTAADALTDPRYAVPASGAVAVVAAVCLLLAMGTRAAPVTRVAAALAALAGFVWLVVAPGWAVAGGPKRLLTSALPLEVGGPELATVVIVAGLAAIGAVEPALRRRAAALPLLAPVAATALGTVVSAGGGTPAGWLAPAFAFGAAVLLVLARYAPDPGQAVTRPDGARPDRGEDGGEGGGNGGGNGGTPRRAAAALMVGALLAGVAAAGWYGPESLARTRQDAPADVRNLVPQQVRPREGTSPLVLYPALRRGEWRLSLTVRAKEAPQPLRYVSLDRFDGEHWTTAARYRRTGRRLPAERNPRPRVTIREERVGIADPGPLGWLVSSGRPVEVSVSGLGVNEDTGDVVLPADRRIPVAYTVRSALPTYDDQTLTTATAAGSAGSAGSAGTGTPPLPARLTSLAARIAGDETGYPALRLLTDYFRSPGPPNDPGGGPAAKRPRFRVDQTRLAPGGHGLYQINRLLDTGEGTAEQYASALAVLARVLGYESRVVMGFRPRRTGPDVYTVSGRDVHAWVEVRFAGIGWVPFDPTPTTSTTDATRAVGPPPRPEPGPADQGGRPAPPDRSARAQGQAGQAGADHGRGTTGYAALALAAVGGLLVGYAGVVPAAKSARRRRRRRRGGPGRRALAAWRDTVDGLVEAGVDVAPADTSGEVVAAARRRFGDRVGLPVGRLALLHDEAAFAPTPIAGPVAEAAWRHADQARSEIRAILPAPHRLRVALSPRAFAARLGAPLRARRGAGR
ncbi:MAG TPA: transglutaminase-like domain-containing protein [Streptosporangiaceae bacterium]|nr:transglutaminase-like domain-containing protein [Streptosporangiaceae bacterium]